MEIVNKLANRIILEPEVAINNIPDEVLIEMIESFPLLFEGRNDFGKLKYQLNLASPSAWEEELSVRFCNGIFVSFLTTKNYDCNFGYYRTLNPVIIDYHKFEDAEFTIAKSTLESLL